MSHGNSSFTGYIPQCRATSKIPVLMGFHANNPGLPDIITGEWRTVPVIKDTAIGVPNPRREHEIVGVYTYEAAMALCYWLMAAHPYSVECRLLKMKCEVNWESEATDEIVVVESGRHAKYEKRIPDSADEG